MDKVNEEEKQVNGMLVYGVYKVKVELAGLSHQRTAGS